MKVSPGGVTSQPIVSLFRAVKFESGSSWKLITDNDWSYPLVPKKSRKAIALDTPDSAMKDSYWQDKKMSHA